MNLWKGSDFIYTTNGNVGDNTWVMTLDGKKIGFNIEPNCGYTLNLEWQKMPPGYEIKGGWEWFDSDDEGSDSDDEGGGVYCWSGLGNAAAEYALTKASFLAPRATATALLFTVAVARKWHSTPALSTAVGDQFRSGGRAWYWSAAEMRSTCPQDKSRILAPWQRHETLACDQCRHSLAGKLFAGGPTAADVAHRPWHLRGTLLGQAQSCPNALRRSCMADCWMGLPGPRRRQQPAWGGGYWSSHGEALGPGSSGRHRSRPALGADAVGCRDLQTCVSRLGVV
ncbi:hypothetical protein OOU_Y34scaffold00883g5 [Pyricularia oryzae Y34]|uniref:Uncharacterized protein n=2 Tax=Pyricularia oryzae TaxID=318829 RepID=A0AA97NP93_PYRO3|nr:hypothetical protein OOU_Y34scaffold00883g5 [Pyricularia oryzae Y34]